MIKIFSYKFTVPADAIDDNGHVNNIAYVQWMQDAAIGHSDATGFPRSYYDNHGTAMIARSHDITFHHPAYSGDEIELFTWVGHIKKTSAVRKFKFLRTKDRAILAVAETLFVYIDRSTGKPCKFQPEFTQAFYEVPEVEEP
jgi:acyl-CoA thioester hydrolase